MEIIDQTALSTSSARVAAVKGRIDQATANPFETALKPFLETCKAASPALVLDFSGVDYISSVGLRVLMLAARQVKSQGGKIVIAALTPVVAEVFQISRFNLVYQIYGTVDLAVAAVTS